MAILAAAKTPTRVRTRMNRAILIAAGSLCVAIGILGIFLPLLPSIEFFLLASVCFARSSERASRWMVTNPIFGKRFSDYRSGRGATLMTKVTTLATLLLSMGATIVLLSPPLWVSALLGTIALGVTVHLLMLKTIRS